MADAAARERGDDRDAYMNCKAFGKSRMAFIYDAIKPEAEHKKEKGYAGI